MRMPMSELIDEVMKQIQITDNKSNRAMVENYIKGYMRCMPPGIPNKIIIDGVAQSFSYH